MAKEFDEIMQDMKAWQEEKEGRAVICFAGDEEAGGYHLAVGKGGNIVAAMGLSLLESTDTKGMVEAALAAVELYPNIKDVFKKQE